MLKPRDCVDVALLGWRWLCWAGDGSVGLEVALLGWRWLCWPGGGSWCQMVSAKLLRLLNVAFAGASTAEAELGPPERILSPSSASSRKVKWNLTAVTANL